jgi:hypothetical protein
MPPLRALEKPLAFAAAATSILCLLSEFYGVASMRTATYCLLLPGTAVLALLAARRGSPVGADIGAGLAAGLVAACAYDLFRAPFVLAGMPLFKVFPLFGAMITGLPPEHGLARAIGWLYHFSNGASFGIMYVLLAGRRRWPLAIAWALALEAGMLLTPYPRFFAIPVTPRFVTVTVLAHAVFGLTLGLFLRAGAAPAAAARTEAAHLQGSGRSR